MCGRYVRKSDKQRIAEAFAASVSSDFVFGESWNVAPQTFQPVVRLAPRTGEREIVMMRWGLVPFFSRDSKCGYSTINARSETVAKSPIFREALRKRRCLVPADAFYEWQKLDAKGKKKQPFAIALKSGELYAFAGVWERWRDAEGGDLLTFSLLTTDANAVVSPMHDRMPVILARKDYARWLGEPGADPRGPEQPPVDLLRAYPAEQMKAWPVSAAVGNVRNDSSELLLRNEATSEQGATDSTDNPPQPALFD
jgi:putative SOS response-associated peptidase YedK